MSKIDDEEFDRHYARLTYELGRTMMNHLRRIYREFDGDLTLCMVLGEIGQHNAGHFMREVLPRSGKDARTMATDEVIARSIRPCNAMSVAEASGIPRQTVQRKIEKLERLGWVTRDGKGGLRVNRVVGRKFRDLDRETLEEVLDLARVLKSLLKEP